MPDHDPDFELFLTPYHGKPYTESDLHVKLSTDFNRRPMPAEEEDQLKQVWRDRIKENPNLWDGSKFRIHSASAENGIAILNLGITGYRDFQCTNFSPRVAEYQRLGLKDHGDTHAHLAHPLGVGAVVHTADDHFILMRRSKFCGEAVGQLDLPGGHPEPEELVGKVPAPDINMSLLSEKDVVHEIFDSILREICDEVNLRHADVTLPVLLGIVRNTPSSGRPTAEFYSRCSLTSAEILARYEQGTQADAEETTNIVFVPMAAILTMAASPEYADLWGQMTAQAKGAVVLSKMTVLVNRFVKDKLD